MDGSSVAQSITAKVLIGVSFFMTRIYNEILSFGKYDFVLKGSKEKLFGIDLINQTESVSQGCQFLYDLKKKILSKKIEKSFFDSLDYQSEFQRKVLINLTQINYGSTITYGELSQKLFGSKKFSQAIGQTLSKNKYLILFPCHRVIGASSVGGFRAGVEVKEYLLELEKKN